jgi:hypothetical protein
MMAFACISTKKFVADAMHGNNQLRLGRILFDLLAQPGDVIINRSSKGEILIAPDRIQQLIASNRFAAMFDEVFQDLEFTRREFERLSFSESLILGEIEFDLSKTISPRIGMGLVLSLATNNGLLTVARY